MRKALRKENRQKAVRKLAKAHAHVPNIGESVLHEISSATSKRFGTVGMGDLNAEGTGRNHCLAKALKDAAFSELRHQGEYKTSWIGGRVVLADRFYPSAKKGSGCKEVQEHLDLSKRIFKCDSCGLEIDLDLNAAVNLKDVAASDTETNNASGGNARPRLGRQTPRKQGPNAIVGDVLRGVGFGQRYSYFAMAFSLLVEVLDLRFRKNRKPMDLRGATGRNLKPSLIAPPDPAGPGATTGTRSP